MGTALQIGLIGCGGIASMRHLPILASRQNVHLTALAEVDESRAEAAARRFGVTSIYPDFAVMLKEHPLDLVVIAIPTPFHASAAIAALEAGAHVFVEKPLAMNLGEANAIAAAAAQAGRSVALGFNYRFHHYVQQAKACMDALGEVPHLINSIFAGHSSANAGANGWHTDPTRGGGALFDLAVHHIDLWHHWTGARIEWISAQQCGPLTVTLQAKLSHGGLATGCFSQQGADHHRFDLRLKNQRLVIEPYRLGGFEHHGLNDPVGGLGMSLHNGTNWAKSLPRAARTFRQGGEPHFAYASMWDQLLGALQRGESHRPGLPDGLAAQRALAAAQESLRTGLPVAVDD